MANSKNSQKKKPTIGEVHKDLRLAHEFRSMETDEAANRTAEVLEKHFPGQFRKGDTKENT